MAETPEKNPVPDAPEGGRKTPEALARAHGRRRAEIIARDKGELGVLRDGEFKPLKQPELPKLVTDPFRLPTSVFLETQTPPLLLDLAATSSDAVICAGYITEFVRYYFGTTFVRERHLEKKPAWEIRNQLLKGKIPAIRVSASLNNFLVYNGKKFDVVITQAGANTRIVKNESAKNTPEYKEAYAQFMSAAETLPDHPPALITFYYRDTKASDDIRAANQSGNDAHNSHITMRLGVGRKELDTGVKKNMTRKVRAILRDNFPHMKNETAFNWMVLQTGEPNLSRVFLNGNALFYKNGDFYATSESTSPVTVSGSDTLEWEDVFVADRFHTDNRVRGVAEMMMTGAYDLVDLMAWNPEALPKKKKEEQTMPFPVEDVIHLSEGQSVSAALLEYGVAPKDLPLQMYAYARVAIDMTKIRTFDPLPVFDEEAVKAEVKKYGGLAGATAELAASFKQQRADFYSAAHPGEYVFVMHANEDANAFAERVFATRELAELGTLSKHDKEVIMTAVKVANPKAKKYKVGETVYLNKEFLTAVVDRVKKLRAEAK